MMIDQATLDEFSEPPPKKRGRPRVLSDEEWLARQRRYSKEYYHKKRAAEGKSVGGPRGRFRRITDGMSDEERATYFREQRNAYKRRRQQQVNHLADDGILTRPKVENDEPIGRYVLDRIVRQECAVSTRAGWAMIGDGCFRSTVKHSGWS